MVEAETEVGAWWPYFQGLSLGKSVTSHRARIVKANSFYIIITYQSNFELRIHTLVRQQHNTAFSLRYNCPPLYNGQGDDSLDSLANYMYSVVRTKITSFQSFSMDLLC